VKAFYNYTFKLYQYVTYVLRQQPSLLTNYIKLTDKFII